MFIGSNCPTPNFQRDTTRVIMGANLKSETMNLLPNYSIIKGKTYVFCYNAAHLLVKITGLSKWWPSNNKMTQLVNIIGLRLASKNHARVEIGTTNEFTATKSTGTKNCWAVWCLNRVFNNLLVW
jgi:hypothetical protein